jgi:hypothetical protein
MSIPVIQVFKRLNHLQKVTWIIRDKSDILNLVTFSLNHMPFSGTLNPHESYRVPTCQYFEVLYLYHLSRHGHFCTMALSAFCAIWISNELSRGLLSNDDYFRNSPRL